MMDASQLHGAKKKGVMAMSQNGTKPPTKYELLVLPRLEEISKMAEDGASERSIAAALGIALCTLQRYKRAHPELAEAAHREDKWTACILPNLDKIPQMAVEMTQGQIADALGVSRSSWDNYKAAHPELAAAVDKGRENLVQELKDALRKKALGFTYEESKSTQRKRGSQSEVTIEKYNRYSPPDIGAIHLLLKNNDPEWRNDDYETLQLKKKQVDIAQQKADDAGWN